MPTGELIKILLVEDDAAFAGMLLQALSERARPVFDVEIARDLAEGLARLAKGGIEAVVLDLGLPDSEGLDTLVKVRAQTTEIPIVVLTVTDNEALASEAVRKGAQDYLVKGEADLKYLARVIRYAVERKRAEDTLRQKIALESINRLMMDREARILELKQEVNTLLQRFGQSSKYHL